MASVYIRWKDGGHSESAAGLDRVYGLWCLGPQGRAPCARLSSMYVYSQVLVSHQGSLNKLALWGDYFASTLKDGLKSGKPKLSESD